MADLAKMVEELSTLTVLEAAELSKMLEEKWGVSAAAPAAAAPAEDVYAQIEKLHRLVTVGAISQEEFDAKKAALMAKIG